MPTASNKTGQAPTVCGTGTGPYTHLVLTQGLSIGLIQNDLHDAKHLLSHSSTPTVLAFLLSYQGLWKEETQTLSGYNHS